MAQDNDHERDDHTSPANPDNRIELGRQAADAEHKAQIVEHPLTPPEDQRDEAPAGMQTGPAAVTPRARPQQRRAAARGAAHRPQVASTGHSWDGIEEYDNPLPRWWLWTFYATVVWAIAYTIAYPAWPLVTQATQGVLHTNYRKELQTEMDRFAATNAAMEEKLTVASLDSIAKDPELGPYAANAGAALFKTWCAQCHGSGAAGAKGYPSLLDNDWLWGGTIDDIHQTIAHGIRDPKDGETRYSEMPKFGADKLLDNTQIAQVANYVLSLSGKAPDAAAAEAGKQVFADNCVACHGEDGKGDRAQGAPNLTDPIWLYGGDLASVEKIIHDGPFGVMPAWSGRLSEAQIRSVMAYVHGLGGGE